MSLTRYDDMDDMFGSIDRRMDRMMNNMMNNMFSSDPFGFNMISPINTFSRFNSLMPSHRFGPNMFDMMNGINGMNSMTDMNGGESSYYCSSSVMSMSTDASGRPQIYEASSSTRAAPGGIRETRNTMRDSMRGLQSMAIGHHIRDRGHVVERSRNYYTGEEEQNDEYINIEETEAPQFNEEWRSGMSNAYGNSRHSSGRHPQLSLTDGHNTQSRSVPQQQLALPAPAPVSTTVPQSSNANPNANVTQNMQRNKMSQKKQKDKKNKNKPYKKG